MGLTYSMPVIPSNDDLGPVMSSFIEDLKRLSDSTPPVVPSREFPKIARPNIPPALTVMPPADEDSRIMPPLPVERLKRIIGPTLPVIRSGEDPRIALPDIPPALHVMLPADEESRSDELGEVIYALPAGPFIPLENLISPAPPEYPRAGESGIVGRILPVGPAIPLEDVISPAPQEEAPAIPQEGVTTVIAEDQKKESKWLIWLGLGVIIVVIFFMLRR